MLEMPLWDTLNKTVLLFSLENSIYLKEGENVLAYMFQVKTVPEKSHYIWLILEDSKVKLKEKKFATIKICYMFRHFADVEMN